eukprot:g6863.t1
MRALAHLALHRISNRVSRPGSKVWRQFNFLETHRNRQVFFSSTDYSTAKSSKRKTNADLPNLVTHDQMLRLLSDNGGKMVTRAFIVYCQLSNYGAIPMRETSELMLSHCFNVQSALKPLEHLMIYEDFNDMELVRRAFDMCSRGNAPHACQIILKMMKRKNMKPTSEMYGFLVNAYSRSGQQAAALNAFQEYVQVYDEKYKNGRHVLYSSAINACHQDYGGDSELKVGTAFEILRDYIEEVQKYA